MPALRDDWPSAPVAGRTRAATASGNELGWAVDGAHEVSIWIGAVGR